MAKEENQSAASSIEDAEMANDENQFALLDHVWDHSGDAAVKSILLCKFHESITRTNHAHLVDWLELDEEPTRFRVLPPERMLEFPGLFELAWGYDRLFPCDDIEDVPEYHAYIHEFYRRNCNAVPSVASVASLCLKMEQNLKSEWLTRGVNVSAKELILNEKIQECASTLIGSKMDAESAATIAYATLCVAKEAQLMIERLRQGARILVRGLELDLTTEIRHYALGLMTGKGSVGSASCAVTDVMVHSALVGIAKEAVWMRKNMIHGYVGVQETFRSMRIREFALDLMMNNLDDYAVAAASAADKSSETFACWKRNFIADIEKEWANSEVALNYKRKMLTCEADLNYKKMMQQLEEDLTRDD